MAARSYPHLEINAPGSFYTTGECTACGAPEAEAPELLAPLTEENYSTYFRRQPQTADEVERACRAIEVCCTSALRYAGTDPAIIQRLGNRAEFCDHALPGGPRRLARGTTAQWRAVRRTWHRAQGHWWRRWW
jgi:hypothetical protein